MHFTPGSMRPTQLSFKQYICMNSAAKLTAPHSSAAVWASGWTSASLSVSTVGLLQARAMREPCFSKLSSPSSPTPPTLKGLAGLSLVEISRYGRSSTTSAPPVVMQKMLPSSPSTCRQSDVCFAVPVQMSFPLTARWPTLGLGSEFKVRTSTSSQSLA